MGEGSHVGRGEMIVPLLKNIFWQHDAQVVNLKIHDSMNNFPNSYPAVKGR